MKQYATSKSNSIDAEDAAPPAAHEEHAVRSLVRGLRILRCFDRQHPKWSLSALIKQTRMHKTTTHRLLKTLEAEGFVTFESATGQYSLGPALFPLTYLSISNLQLAQVARPHMERLAAATGESAGLAVWAGDGALLLAFVLTSRPFKPASTEGGVFHDPRNSHCKVLLTFMPEAARAQALARSKEFLPSSAAIDSERLRADLDCVSLEEVAYDLEESDKGICSAAAPVRDHGDEVRASLAVVAPRERFGPAEIERCTRLLRQAAAALLRDLQGSVR